MSTVLLPPVAPDVLADAVEQLSARLRKKLDAAIADCAERAVVAADGSVEVRFGEDAAVTLRPGPSGAVTAAEQAVCSCLLAPRCLHRAATLGAAPLADGEESADDDGGTGPTADDNGDSGEGTVADTDTDTDTGAATVSATGTAAAPATSAPAPSAPVPASAPAPAPAVTKAQVHAAGALWEAAAEALSAGVTAGGAVVQAELLRAAHTARLAGLPRAEAAALRVVRGLRAARERSSGQGLGDLAGAFRELLAGAALLAAGSADGGAAGSARRVYEQGGSLRVFGLCREPVLSATGYGGVTTHLLGADGAGYTVSDVRPGGLARVKGAGSASVALGGGVLDHAGLARGGLLIVGATVSADGRLGAGRKVSATPLRGVDWSEEPAAVLFARPVREAMAAVLDHAAAEGAIPPVRAPGCWAATGGGRRGRRQCGGPGRRGRAAAAAAPRPPPPGVAARRQPAPDRRAPRGRAARARTSRPGPGGDAPAAGGRSGAGRRAHPAAAGGLEGPCRPGLPPAPGRALPHGTARPAAPGPVPAGPDPLADAPLWRVRRLLETGVAGGRRAVAEAGRGTDAAALAARLTRAGLGGAADLARAHRGGRPPAPGRLRPPDRPLGRRLRPGLAGLGRPPGGGGALPGGRVLVLKPRAAAAARVPRRAGRVRWPRRPTG
ncbi:hypothetical protein AB6O49_00925 [Streptomyces sp. SBR177]